MQGRGVLQQPAQALLHAVVLLAVDQRSHAHSVVARVAYGDFGQLCTDGLGHTVVQSLRYQHAAYGRAFLAGFDRHFAHHLTRQQGGSFAVRAMAGQQQRAVHAVGLDIAAHRMAADGRVRAYGRSRLRRPCERDHIHGLQLIEQSGGTAADDGQRPRRQYAGIDHIPDHALGQPGGGRGRLDDDGHAREQGRSRFFPQPPGREVEGVDEQRHAARRDLDMP